MNHFLEASLMQNRVDREVEDEFCERNRKKKAQVYFPMPESFLPRGLNPGPYTY
jgi:hypothetical protein